MPTGYTAILFDKPDTTFREFLLRCSRAFGACIEMRDDGLDVPPPKAAEPDAYALTSLQEAEAKVRELETMTLEEATQRATAERDKCVAYNIEYRTRFNRESELVASMLAQAEAWEPPTKAHDALRDFMIQQLNMSKPYDYKSPEVLLSGPDWLDQQRRAAAENLVRRAEDWKRARESASEKTEWLRKLWESAAALPTGSADGTR